MIGVVNSFPSASLSWFILRMCWSNLLRMFWKQNCYYTKIISKSTYHLISFQKVLNFCLFLLITVVTIASFLINYKMEYFDLSVRSNKIFLKNGFFSMPCNLIVLLLNPKHLSWGIGTILISIGNHLGTVLWQGSLTPPVCNMSIASFFLFHTQHLLSIFLN